MIETRDIGTGPGLVFDVSVAGEAGAPLVMMLHGFCVSRFYWHAQMEALAGAGLFAAAPNQRGYAAGARPDPATRLDAYAVERLIGDVFDLVAALGHGDRRFHLAGHDWGGSLAWHIADAHPERVASLTMLSRPHPQAFNRALALPDGDQKYRSRHHGRFMDPKAGDEVLAEDAKWLRERLARNGVPAVAVARHLSVIGNPAAMEAALAWYRARGVRHEPAGVIRVPTLFVWGDADDTVGRAAAEGTGAFVEAPYRFEVVAGGGHYVAEQHPALVSRLMAEHVLAHPA